ncbi:MAG: bifunctional phosphoribosylaminoimidazolecarboxamide formyltransferase/IMP cyclohydrolase, partial [Candidatus Omnitrophica bacterium]|nr:bifunctional phosphoribosylaminoimidazolecarboxamide formyltransferase/IMP cyclohydrolase [Candidatus Omnitrophota bacterium]
MLKIKRALISVSDKTGIVEFASELKNFGVEILSTGGTAKLLRESNISVTEVSDYTGFPEMLDGRVKTLHPKIHAGLLALRDNPQHMAKLKEHKIGLIDMVVVNLYPFEKTIQKPYVTLEEAIENIDIGGPAMLRSAAKNYRSVAVICDSRFYPEIIKELKENQGSLSENTLFKLAREVFNRTLNYDKAIYDYLSGKSEVKSGVFAAELKLEFSKIQDLRYGENPHQKAAFYRDKSASRGLINLRQLQGKELSFNNILDLNSSWNLVLEFVHPACAIIKHNNPCGVAEDKTLARAFKRAWECDKLSAFGGIVALNRQMDLATAKIVLKAGFLECIIAPGYEKGVADLFKEKKNLRLIELTDTEPPKGLDYKVVNGGLLLQDADYQTLDLNNLKVVTKKKPTKKEMQSLIFAFKVAKHVKSNAIVLAKGTRTVGIGAGQMSRVDSVMIARHKAGKNAKGCVLASDAFFPKPDAIQQAKKAGAKAIIQPGGSVADEEIIRTCDKAGIAMV